MSTTAIDPFAAINGTSTTTTRSTGSAGDAGTADRFLKLLVTQMQNQDPLNPMDNAQVTSQLAQINTVSGLATLNTTVGALNGQFVQLQALQGASVVGREITLAGNKLDVVEGTATGGFDLGATADNVKVEVLDGSGRVVDTLKLGAQTAGRHEFDWKASAVGAADGANYSFRITATSGATAVTATPLMRDVVEAVNSQPDGITLETRHSGDVAYADVKAFN